jgi:pimeloyl-ACP methyl ester carboxylesterase
VLISVAEEVELHVEVQGEGDPLVLLHGFTGSARDWDGVVPRLADGRQVVTVEHRGHGRSTNTGDAATYRFDQLVADLRVVVEHLGLAPFDLLGHSMGGVVAMRYALGHPGRLRSLLLMDTGAGAAPGDGESWLRGGIELARTGGTAAVLEAIAPFVGDEERAGLEANLGPMDGVAFATLGEELLAYGSVLPQLAHLDLPTTVLVGEHDTGLRTAADDLAGTIPGAVLEVIAGAGHSPQTDQPEAWLGVVRRHLERRP